MRPYAALLLAFLAATRLTPAQVCAPTTRVEREFRSAMKHRAPGPRIAPAVLPAELLAWPPPAGAAKFRVRSADGPIDPREERAVMLVGDLWRVKVEENECNLHLELSAPGAGRDAPRIVADVPAGPGYELARASALEAIRLPSARARDRVDLAATVRVVLTGYGFWDGAQWCRRDGVRGCGHGTATVATLWELHPVWRVELVAAGAPVRPDGLRVPCWPPAPPDDLRAPRFPPTASDGLRGPLRRPDVTGRGGDAPPTRPPSGERLRCCDGSRSPTCRVGRANGAGCCRGHGGVCAP